MEYTRRAGPPFEDSHLDLTTQFFSICLKVRYKAPGFMASNPKAAVRSMSSETEELHSRKVNRITRTSHFRGRAATARFCSSLLKTPTSKKSYIDAVYTYRLDGQDESPWSCNVSAPESGCAQPGRRWIP